MQRIFWLVLAVLASIPAGPVRAEQADINAAARSVVRVVLIAMSDDDAMIVSHGTGFAIGRDKILTNAHVVEQAVDSGNIGVGVIPAEGSERWGARIVTYSPRNDLALLQLSEGGSLEPMALFTGPVADGADIFAIGYPGSVDRAQGLNMMDMITSMSPVKSPGTLSAGRSAKVFDTLLHTAAIGAGNSGGPLVDGCGRVLGVNSFGTVGGQSDSEFYFAVSMREVMRFLTRAEVKATTTGSPCRSIAELNKLNDERTSQERERERRAVVKHDRDTRDALDRARLEVISERENGMALAGLCLLFMLVCGGGAIFFTQQAGKKTPMAIAAGLGVLFLAGAVAAWLSRPSMSDAQVRAQEAIDEQGASAGDGKRKVPLAGKLVCVLDLANSRVTVSDANDVPFTWSEDGCVNARTQYGLGSDGWKRILVPNEDQTVTAAAFDPTQRIYQTQRYLLDLKTMELLREKRAEIQPPSCHADEQAARKFGTQQARLSALLPEQPNELLVYNCGKQR